MSSTLFLLQQAHQCGVGVQSRNFSNERIYSTGWQARFPLIEGIKRTYPWIEAQAVGAARQK